MMRIVDYIYSSNIDIASDNVQALVQACDQFHFDGLKQACEAFMMQQVEANNCIGLYKFAKLYGLIMLATRARYVMLTDFKSVVAGNEYVELSEEDLLEYLDDDELQVATEDPVFRSVVIWANSAPESSRRQSFSSVVEHVRLPYCTGAYLCHVVSTEDLMLSEPCQKLLVEARMFHMLPDHRHELDSERMVPRRSFHHYRHVVVVGGLTKQDRETRYCWYLDEDTAIWELLAQVPRPNWKFYSVCCVQQGILITGGYHASVKKECWLFDTMEKKWKAMPAMQHGRCKHRAVVHSNVVYVIGGEDDNDKPLSSVESFDMKTREWTTMKDMNKALSDPLVASYGHQIFVFAGIDGTDATSTLTQAYDTVWCEWSVKSTMPEDCRLGAVTTVNERIFIVGGYTRSCMCYNPLSDVWTLLKRPREKHGNAPAVVWRGHVLVGGGDVDTSETTSVVEEYDPSQNEWFYWKVPLKEPLSCHYMLNIDLNGV